MNDLKLLETSVFQKHVKVSKTGLIISEGISYKEWEHIGKTLQQIGGAIHWWIGDWIRYGEANYGEKYSQAIEETGYDYDTLTKDVWVCKSVDFCRRRQNLSFSAHAEVAKLEPEEQIKWLDKAEKENIPSKELRQAIRDSEPDKVIKEPPESKYRTIVIDPPWPVEKILREVRPNQEKQLDYKVMSIDAIKTSDLILKRFDDNCHVYLWTTHKFLPIAFEIFEAWGVNYECLMTWSKNVGMTPFSWMYSTEHCLFGRKGSLDLLKKGERLDFPAKVREHSRKPDEFYDLVKKVSPAPRVDIFARGKHDGFDRVGDEIDKF